MKAHLRGVLNSEVAEPAQAEHGDDVARPCAAVSQRIESGDAGAHQGGRINGRQVGGHSRNGAGRRDHVLRVAAVECETGDLTGHAGEELPTAALTATPAIAAVPTDARPLARRPSDDAGADRIDHPGRFMTGHARILNTRESSLFDEGIAVADAASLHLDPHRTGAWFRYLPFNDLQGPTRSSNLHNAHRRHDSSSGLRPSGV